METSPSAPQSKPKASKGFLIAAAVFLVLAPVLTVAFSKFGLDRFRQAKKEMTLLADSIRLDSFLAITPQADTFSNNSIKGRLAIFHFFDDNNSPAWAQMRRVQREYSKEAQDNLKILYLSLPMADSGLVADNGVKMDSLNWFVLNQNLSAQTVLDKAKIRPEDAKYQLLLIDARGYLCKAYDSRKQDDINLLLRHISIVMPKTKRKKYVYKKDNTFFENEENS